MKRDPRALMACAAALGSYPPLVIAALWPQPWSFLVLCVLSYAAEIVARRHARRLVDTLSKVHLGVTLRFTIRETAAIILVARTAGTDSPWFMIMVLGMLALHGVRALQTGLAIAYAGVLKQLPVLARNVDGVVRLPAPPPDILINHRSMRALYLDVFPIGGAALGAVLGTGYQGAVGALIALGAGAAGVVALLPHLRRIRPLRNRDRVLKTAGKRLAKYRPEVILYFSGPDDSAYQATMWLRPLERIDRRVVVVLRERSMLRLLGETSLPVVCIPAAADLMSFEALGSARVCLYPSNVGKNIHMLRIRGLRSVFVGHGDSDKEASFNPFTKVYDEVWVAGQAGRDRYLRARVGVGDEDVHEVGRPQLTGVRTTGPGLPFLTVLYAPTWEGWTDDLFHTSIITMGPAIVRTLLARSPALRVIYKPHPLTGYRNPAARRAHQEILAMLERAELSRSIARHPAGTARAEPIRHLAVIGPEPPLYECFNQADLMITDISSLVADFIASGKPYVVTNVAGLPERAFRERYPSTEAGYLLTEDLDELPVVLAALESGGEDVLAAARRKLRSYLLGPDHPDAMTRFNDAVNGAWRRAAGEGVGTGGSGSGGAGG
ncbi:CDP-glycerol glycerophosphotransferase family protein [Streptosporangium sp. CA-135522]|uniref:CDP-glycerol glycerophosphotransferase family protein n=1 Tax=Streptosporangium sp. CA-135522 TaxID=3240072 RepID=UPI003D8D0A6B